MFGFRTLQINLIVHIPKYRGPYDCCESSATTTDLNDPQGPCGPDDIGRCPCFLFYVAMQLLLDIPFWREHIYENRLTEERIPRGMRTPPETKASSIPVIL